MKFGKLFLQNFMTLGEAEISLADRGLLLVQGENRDDSSTDSNGAGKSSLLEGLSWVVYGTTAKGVTGDDVINNRAKKECFGSVHFSEPGGEIYRVRRYRKSKEHKNALYFEQVQADGVTVILDLTRGTERETQAEIERVLGCPYEVFKSAVYSGQEAMPDLPSMTDKQLKLLVEEAAGITRLEEAYKRASGCVQDRKEALSALQVRQSKLGIELDGCKQLEGELEEQSKLWLDNSAATIKRLEEREKELSGEVDALKAKDAHGSLAKLNGEIERVNKAIEDASRPGAALVKAETELAELRKINPSAADQPEIDRLNRQIAIKQADMDRKVSEAKSLKSRYDNAEAELAKPCTECGKPHTPEELETLKSHLLEKTKATAGEATTIKNELAVLTTDLNAAKQRQADAIAAHESKRAALEATIAAEKAAVVKPTELLERLGKLNAGVTTLRTLINDLANKEAELKRLQAELDRERHAANPVVPRMAAAEERRGELEETIAIVIAEIEKATVELEVAEEVKRVYSPAGVRAHILDTVTPYLNDRTSHYLGGLSDGNITAQWSTLSTTSKGELREKFTIHVTNEKGAANFAGLSGGEKRKVRLACAMALQDLVASRATKPVDLFIADEVDHALDTSGLERLMVLLEEKARERGSVIVISHNDLNAWVDQHVTVVKEGGISRVEV
ncbi:AAA family ATPase [Chitinibacter tainanensis]|uniref:AAA family ATPase n=1 Tax=Chitinibacter tainanensis TaxID=230667 RepID=UPI0003FBDC2D|nr:SMC family ATPase [Chitinibacter tainanensis]